MLNDDLHKRLLKRFEIELGLWDAIEGTHLVMIGTFGVSTNGIASLEEVALMNVTEHWIPFESTFRQDGAGRADAQTSPLREGPALQPALNQNAGMRGAVRHHATHRAVRGPAELE